jgi:hypothetical protein
VLARPSVKLVDHAKQPPAWQAAWRATVSTSIMARRRGDDGEHGDHGMVL